jgi:hypothetical protein
MAICCARGGRCDSAHRYRHRRLVVVRRAFAAVKHLHSLDGVTSPDTRRCFVLSPWRNLSRRGGVELASLLVFLTTERSKSNEIDI